MRKSVRLFAEAMEKKLVENDHKGGWGPCNMEFLTAQTGRQRDELLLAIERWYAVPRGDREWQKAEVVRRAVNLANFAMMIADNAGGLKEEKHEQED